MLTKQVSLVDKPAPRDFEQAALKKGPDNWKLANKKITAFQKVLKQNLAIQKFWCLFTFQVTFDSTMAAHTVILEYFNIKNKPY